MAAKARYFVSDDDILYFHSYMADYFLGTYGGGINKPFRSKILWGLYEIFLTLTGRRIFRLCQELKKCLSVFVCLHV